MPHLTHAIFKFFGWQVWVSLHVEVPAIQLYNGPIFHLAQDLRDRLIGVTLRTESEHGPLLSGSESPAEGAITRRGMVLLAGGIRGHTQVGGQRGKGESIKED